MFKDSFKYYKSKKDPPDLGTVIDFDQPVADETSAIPYAIPTATTPPPPRPDCVPPQQWRCFELRDRPGLLVVRNPFTAHGQRYWMARCLRDYPKPPHHVNINAAASTITTSSEPPPPSADWWQTLQQVPRSDLVHRQRMRSAMRWATLGYHHNWDTKEYAESARHQFPDDLAALTRYVASVLGVGGDRYEAQAAIVNFYPQGSTLAGHTDHSERDLAAPLFSFSFGQTAIFLIGGPTVDQRPAAVFLRSGDIAVMSRQSRLSYHAVPRILHGAAADVWHLTTPSKGADDVGERIEPHAKRKKPDDSDVVGAALEAELWTTVCDAQSWRPFDEYVTECRININVRQVLPQGVSGLDETPKVKEIQ